MFSLDVDLILFNIADFEIKKSHEWFCLVHVA